MGREIIDPEAGVVDGVSIRSGQVPVQSIHPRPATSSAGDLHLKTTGSASNRERERQLESAEASSMAVICRLAVTEFAVCKDVF